LYAKKSGSGFLGTSKAAHSDVPNARFHPLLEGAVHAQLADIDMPLFAVRIIYGDYYASSALRGAGFEYSIAGFRYIISEYRKASVCGHGGLRDINAPSDGSRSDARIGILT